MRVGRFVGEVLTVLFQMRFIFLALVILVAIAFFVARIDPTREYGFGGGVLHGFFGIQNSILWLFTRREIWAPVNTGRGYTAGFYAGVFVLPFLTRNTIRAAIFIFRQRYSKVP